MHLRFLSLKRFFGVSKKGLLVLLPLLDQFSMNLRFYLYSRFHELLPQHSLKVILLSSDVVIYFNSKTSFLGNSGPILLTISCIATATLLLTVKQILVNRLDLMSILSLHALPILCHCSHSIRHENIRKPELFWYF